MSGTARLEPTDRQEQSTAVGWPLSTRTRGDYYCFYEINPNVRELASTYFSYLGDTPAEVRIEMGDARLSMERQSPQGYDVIALDAFSAKPYPFNPPPLLPCVE